MSKVDILLVEDRAEDAEMTIMGLKQNKAPIEIEWVTNGLEALDFLKAQNKFKDRDTKEKPKVILLDLKMPKMDGIETLKEIRADKNLKDLPVVILTTSKEESDLIAAYNYYVNSYIIKPVDYEKFQNVIQELGLYWLFLNENTKKKN